MDVYHFKKGDPVPTWLAVPESVYELRFGTDVRVHRHTALNEVFPEREMLADEAMIIGEGHEMPYFPFPVHLHRK